MAVVLEMPVLVAVIPQRREVWVPKHTLLIFGLEEVKGTHVVQHGRRWDLGALEFRA